MPHHPSLLLLLTAALAGAGGLSAGEAPPVIPVVAAYTGQLASFSEGIANAARLKAKELAAAGTPIEVRLVDDVADPKEAAAVATRLVNDPQVAVVVGHLTSTTSLTAAPIYATGRLVSISPTATNPALGNTSPFTFRNVYRDDFQGAFLARYGAKVMGWKRIAIFHDTNDYGTGLQKAFIASAAAAGLEIVAVEGFTAETTDFRPLLTRLRLKRPDALFVSGYAPQGALVAAQARQARLEIPLFGADGLDDEAMVKTPEAEGTLVTTPFLPGAASPAGQAFVKAYMAEFGKEPSWFAANAYDAVGLAAAACFAAGSDRDKVRAHLAAYASAETAFPGITGPTWFDADGDCQKPAFVKRLQGGVWVAADKQLAE